MSDVIETVGDFVGGIFGVDDDVDVDVPEIPEPPELPELGEPPQLADQSVQVAAQRRRRRARAGGRRSTILGGAVGGDQNLMSRTLLGE